MSAIHDSPPSTLFDAEFLDAYTGGDDETRDQILKLFLVQSHLLFGKLEMALGRPKAWLEAAHSLKGCARSVGANTLADLAARAESEFEVAEVVQRRRLGELERALGATSTQVEALIHGPASTRSIQSRP
jgi:HPt (histidine-containing phosphotransfer) domain-containing protein